MARIDAYRVVEAKRNDFDQGWGQCLAELVAAQKLNDQSDRVVYGIVTDGKRREIGKLIQNQFTQNACGYTVSKLLNCLRATGHF